MKYRLRVYTKHRLITLKNEFNDLRAAAQYAQRITVDGLLVDSDELPDLVAKTAERWPAGWKATGQAFIPFHEISQVEIGVEK